MRSAGTSAACVRVLCAPFATGAPQPGPGAESTARPTAPHALLGARPHQVWVAGIATRPFTKHLVAQMGPERGQTNRRALRVDSHLQVIGAESDHVWALGDCAAVKGCGPTAQAASQQGKYLGWLFNELADTLHASARSWRASSGGGGGYGGTEPATLAPADADGEEVARRAALVALEGFQFRNRGKMAYLGGADAVVEVGRGACGEPRGASGVAG